MFSSEHYTVEMLLRCFPAHLLQRILYVSSGVCYGSTEQIKRIYFNLITYACNAGCCVICLCFVFIVSLLYFFC